MRGVYLRLNWVGAASEGESLWDDRRHPVQITAFANALRDLSSTYCAAKNAAHTTPSASGRSVEPDSTDHESYALFAPAFARVRPLLGERHARRAEGTLAFGDASSAPSPIRNIHQSDPQTQTHPSHPHTPKRRDSVARRVATRAF